MCMEILVNIIVLSAKQRKLQFKLYFKALFQFYFYGDFLTLLYKLINACLKLTIHKLPLVIENNDA